MAMPRQAGGDDCALRELQGREEGGGGIPLRIMRHGPTPALLEGQVGLGSIEGLNQTLP